MRDKKVFCRIKHLFHARLGTDHHSALRLAQGRPACDQSEASSDGAGRQGVQLPAAQGQPDRVGVGGDPGVAHGAGRRLGLHGVPPQRGDRGLLHRRPRRRTLHRTGLAAGLRRLARIDCSMRADWVKLVEKHALTG